MRFLSKYLKVESYKYIWTEFLALKLMDFPRSKSAPVDCAVPLFFDHIFKGVYDMSLL